MKNISQETNFDRDIWIALNKIKSALDKKQPSAGQVVKYYKSINPLKKREIPLVRENRVLEFLKDKGVVIMVDQGWGQIGDIDYFDIYDFKVTSKFDVYYSKYQKLQHITEGFCWMTNNTFFLKLKNGFPKAINFDTQRGSNKMLITFSLLFRNWKLDGDPLSKQEIVDELKQNGIKHAKLKGVKNIISNLRRTKIRALELENYLSITYDRSENGYSLQISRQQ